MSGFYPPVLHCTDRVLAGPQVDSFRFGLFSPDVISPHGLEILQDAKSRALGIRANDDLSHLDIATPWPAPNERAGAVPGEWIDPRTGEVLQVWREGTSQVLPKIARGPILADLQTDERGPGWIRIRGGRQTKRYPYAVILDLSARWLWRHKNPKRAAAAAVKFWIDSEVLDPLALGSLSGGAGHRITRCDIACDHTAKRPWVPESYRYFATRARQKGFEAGTPKDKTPDTPQASAYFGPSSFTLYLGKRGGEGALFRIYDKTAQLSATRPKGADSAWFWSPLSEVWTINGWDRKTTVWRVEVEVPSRMLNSLDGGCARMSTLQGLDVPRLWRHCMENTRHTLSDTGRGDRRQTSPLWQMLSAAMPGAYEWRDGETIPRIPSKPENTGWDLDTLTAAVTRAVEMGASECDIKAATHRGFCFGVAARAKRLERLAKVQEAEKRHAPVAGAGDVSSFPASSPDAPKDPEEPKNVPKPPPASAMPSPIA